LETIRYNLSMRPFRSRQRDRLMRRINPSLAVFIALSLSTTGASGGEHAKPKGSPPKRPPTSLKSCGSWSTRSRSRDPGRRHPGEFTGQFLDVPDASAARQRNLDAAVARCCCALTLRSTSLGRGGRHVGGTVGADPADGQTTCRKPGARC